MSKISKVGISPALGQGPKAVKLLIRLQIAEFTNQDLARKEQQKLRAANIDSYVRTEEGQKARVYTGSYSDENTALKEQKRLAGMGISSSLKKTESTVATFLLSAGSFSTREAALEMAAKLEKEGVKSTVAIH